MLGLVLGGRVLYSGIRVFRESRFVFAELCCANVAVCETERVVAAAAAGGPWVE